MSETDETGTLIGSDKVEGTAVYGADREKIGSIERVMIDKMSGKVSYAVLSFGGFLGIGHDHYPLPWSSLKYDTNLGGYITGITEDHLKGAPNTPRTRHGIRLIALERLTNTPRLGSDRVNAGIFFERARPLDSKLSAGRSRTISLASCFEFRNGVPKCSFSRRRRVTTGRNGDRWTQSFCRFLAATTTHRYACTSNPFPAPSLIQ